MIGFRLWRCSRCSERVAVVVDRTKLFCGECFYRQTVERVMTAAFVPDVPKSNERSNKTSTTMVITA
jgi:hypothetical protein